MIITIEGNIGAGKTTFAKALYEKIKELGHRVVYIPEPVETWTYYQGINLLDMFYSDRKRWSFTFQVNALLHMTKWDEQAIEYMDKGFTVVKERSSFSVRNIFTPLISESLSPAERYILDELSVRIEEPFRTEPYTDETDVTIYMRTDPEICYERIKKRGRPEELDGRVDLPYLMKLHEMHELRIPGIRTSRGRLIVADGNTFNADDPESVKIFGRDKCVFTDIHIPRDPKKIE